MALKQFSGTGLIGTLILTFAVWRLSLVIHRLYYHPLATFPGPLLARFSYLDEYYHDLWLPGQFKWKLKEVHRQYGPVIRINPDELHVNDPDYYDEMYNNVILPVEKPAKSALVFGPYPAVSFLPNGEKQREYDVRWYLKATAIGTIGHDLHRIRRSALNPFFSRRSVTELIPFLNPIVQNLIDRLEGAATRGETVNLKYAYNALTMDNMTEYCSSTRTDGVLLPDFDRQTLNNVESFVSVSQMNFHLPWIFGPVYTIPDWLNRIVAPKMADIIDLRERLSQQVEDIRSGKDRSHEKSGHRTIFHDLLSESSNLPTPEKEKPRIRDEAFSLVTAGSLTTAHILSTTTYHLMANPTMREKLATDLKTVMPTREGIPNLLDLEKTPHLTAAIHEGLRMSHASAHRLVRAFPNKALVCHGKSIPLDTIISMTSLLLHENKEIFPQPHEFRPERWLTTASDRTEISRTLRLYFTPFSHCTRACLGLNLAWAELYVVLALVFRRFEFDVSRVWRAQDSDVSRDMLIGVPDPRSEGVVVSVNTVD